MAGGKGIALHKEGGEDLRAVLGGHATSDQSLHKSDKQQIQNQSCGEEGVVFKVEDVNNNKIASDIY